MLRKHGGYEAILFVRLGSRMVDRITGSIETAGWQVLSS